MTVQNEVGQAQNNIGVIITVGIVIGLLSAWLTTRAIVRPVTKIVSIATDIANGDLGQNIDIRQRDEIGRLADAFRRMQTKITNVLQETDTLIQAVQDGRLDARGNADAFAGSWRELVVGVNNVIDAFVVPIDVTAEYLDCIAKGNIPEKINDEYNGDFNEIKNNLNQCIDAVNGLVAETSTLIEAAIEGQLSVRGDTGQFQGDFAKIVQGMNATLDAVVGPLNVAATYVSRIAQGDIPEQIVEEYKGNFNEIKNNLNLLIEAMNGITRLAEEMADGNLTVEVKERSTQDTLMQALNTMVQRLSTVAFAVKTASNNVASGGQTISSSAAEMSQGANQQATAAEEASSSMEQMVANIRQNSDNALQTGKIAMKAAEDARQGGQAVVETVRAMKKIAKKISIIEEIARQTRLLSLNATIEAARAQDHGRGFAVVASEVRSLSERSQMAAEEINQLASSSVEIAGKAGEMLAKLVPDIQKTAELVQEIGAASNEQNTGAEQISRAIQQLDNVIQQNAGSSEEMTATAEELASQAEQLQSTMMFFRIAENAQIPESTRELETGQIYTKSVKRKTHHHSEMTEAHKDTSSGGYIVNMPQKETVEDDQDAEFERY
ncbi:MAG: HAMP domain-containing protein [bacterium]|nr:HAMP domain-containing protein [bacterium]